MTRHLPRLLFSVPSGVNFLRQFAPVVQLAHCASCASDCASCASGPTGAAPVRAPVAPVTAPVAPVVQLAQCASCASACASCASSDTLVMIFLKPCKTAEILPEKYFGS